MFKVVAILAVVGVASAGNIGLVSTVGLGNIGVGPATVLSAAPGLAIASGYGAGVAAAAALQRNANIQAAINQANQNAASNTLALISADNANRNIINAAAVNNYAAARNAAIQGQQLALARYAASAVTVPQVASLNLASPLALSVGSPLINAASLGYGINTLGVNNINAAAINAAAINAAGLNAAGLGYGINAASLGLPSVASLGLAGRTITYNSLGQKVIL